MAKAGKKALSEEAIQNLEAQIPDMAAGATHAAFIRALAAGHTVMRVQGTHIVESTAEGCARVVGEAKPRHKVTVGKVFKVRRVSA